MNLFTKKDLDEFLNGNYLTEDMLSNGGGMMPPDLFSFYYVLKKLQPNVVVESGVYHGISTKFIRKVLGPDVYIICLDPLAVPETGFKDSNPRTMYFTGSQFKDFAELDLSVFKPDSILCFFDDHQNAVQRVLQSLRKGMKHLFFNDNYPVGAGSHYTLTHLLDHDPRNVFDLHTQFSYSINVFPQASDAEKQWVKQSMEEYQVFPNVFPAYIYLEQVYLSEGILTQEDSENPKYQVFLSTARNYNWNTYVKLTSAINKG